MTFKEIFTSSLSQKRDWLQGTYRWFMYRKFPLLLRSFVKDAFEKRKELAKDCYLNGSCLHCGCETPQVFFASRGCLKDDPCYLPLKQMKNETME